MTWQLGAFSILGLALVAGFGWYERSRPDARIVALVATLAAFAALGRIAFAALPNVKPTTDIVLVSGYALGAGPGFVVGALAALSSNFFFGQGPWTPWQMAGWGVTGLIGAWLGAALGRRTPPRWPLAIVCMVVGFAFTALQDVGDWVTYSDHSSSQLAVYVGKGLGFDAVHAGSCLVFALAFGPALARSVGRFARRLHVSWTPPVRLGPLALLVAAAVGVAAGSAPPRARAAGAVPGAGVARAVAYLVRSQNSDGGFGAGPGQPSSALFSGWAALGLSSAGIDTAAIERVGHSITSYLARSDTSADPGSLERTILALRAAGLAVGGPRGLLTRLKRDVRPDGSISEQVNLTAFAVLALRGAGAPVPERTIAWLVRQADGDGGFGFGTAGGQSDVDDTGAVLEALHGISSSRADRDRSRAVEFIDSHQNRDGGFPSSPGEGSNAQSTAWAVQGLLAAGSGRSAVAPALGYLGGLEAPNGSVRYAAGMNQTPIWVTGEALMALERKPLPLAPVLPAATRTRSREPGALTADRAGDAAAVQLAVDAGALIALALAPIGL